MLVNVARGVGRRRAAWAVVVPLIGSTANAQQTTSSTAPPPAPISTGVRPDVPPLPVWPDFSAPPRYGGPNAVRVRIATEAGEGSATLMERTSDGWRSVCATPCTTQVDGRDTFAFGGYGIAPSKTFKLTEPTSITVSPASTYAGVAYLATGGFFVLHGGSFFLVGSSIGSEAPGPVFRTLGLIELVVAVPLLITGFYRQYWSTSFDMTPDRSARAPWPISGLTF